MKRLEIPEAWKKEIRENPDSEFSVRAKLVQQKLAGGITEVNRVRPKTAPVISVSHTGTYLHKIIERDTHKKPCSECWKEIVRLNGLTPDQVMEQIEEITERIYKNAASGSVSWFVALAVRVAPEMARHKIRDWIIEAVETARK